MMLAVAEIIAEVVKERARGEASEGSPERLDMLLAIKALH
jgi:hypothetical protein